jgi:hypothetical protein
MTGDCELEMDVTDVDRDLSLIPEPDLSFVTKTDSDVAEKLVKSRDMERDLGDLAIRSSFGGTIATEGEGEREVDVTDCDRDLSLLPLPDFSLVTTKDSDVADGPVKSPDTEPDLDDLATRSSFGDPIAMEGEGERETDVTDCDRDLSLLPLPYFSLVTTSDSDVADGPIKSPDMERDLDDLATRSSFGGPIATEGEGEREADVTDCDRDLSLLPLADLCLVTTTDSVAADNFGLPRDTGLDLDDLETLPLFGCPFGIAGDCEREAEDPDRDLDLTLLPGCDPSSITTADSALANDFIKPRGTERDLDELETRPSFDGAIRAV